MTSRLFTIAPHAPFLKLLAARVLDGTLLGDWAREGSFWLSDVTIILPTRRAADALAKEFLQLSGGGLLLPDIRTFGGEAEDEEPFLPPHDAPPPPAQLPPEQRRLILAELVEAWIRIHPRSPLAEGGAPNPVQVLSLADSLATLIDDFHVEQVGPASLRDLKDKELADYWRDCLAFLEIAFEHWPQALTEAGQIDKAEARNLRLMRQAETAPLVFGERPVIAAGSTGSVPATAELMKAITGLPRGALVLPGLDTSVSAASLRILRDPAQQPHGHAQYQLVQLLDRLGAEPQQVIELADPESAPRTGIVRRALVPAEETAQWHESRQVADENASESALEQVALAVAHNEQEQAAAVALAGVDALRAGKQVGIIAPDRNLARRISSELRRFGIEVDDSAGAPLFQSRTGRLLRQTLAVARGNFAPVDLMVLLRNRYVCLGMSRAELAEVASALEYGLLRGQRPAPGIDGLRRMLEINLNEDIRTARKLTTAEGSQVSRLLELLRDAVTPLIVLAEKSFPASALSDALAQCLDLLRQSAEGQVAPELSGELDFRSWAGSLSKTGRPGPLFDLDSAEAGLEQLMAGHSVRPRVSGDPRIAIWGRLEARLQPADLMILTALNEGSWPEVADPGPWLNRQMRLAVGLEPPERQHGLAAHDFEMALGAPEVLLTLSERSGNSPVTPSRLVQRLLGYVGNQAADGLKSRGQKWVRQARMLDQGSTPVAAAARPAPQPPAAKRARQLSITQVEKLIRSPYDIYANRTLRLHQIEPLGAEVGARERGNFIHQVFADFVINGHDPLAPDARSQLLELAQQEFAALETMPERRDIWLKRFEASAEKYLLFERERAPRIAERHAEQKLDWSFDVKGESFRIYGRADRIDLLKDGSCEIIDFKTGGVPTATEMKSYLAPQLLLEALIVGKAGFGEDAGKVAACNTSALTYIRLGANPSAFEEKPFVVEKGVGLMEASDEIFARLQRHIIQFLLNDDQPMMAALYPKPNQQFAGEYDHLARLQEWTVSAEEAE